jgi:integrase
MAPRKPNGIDIRRNADGTTSYRIRWRQGGGRDGQQCSHTFTRRVDAVDALRSIELAGWMCYCERHAPGDVEPGQFGAQARPRPLTWGGYAMRQIENRTGIGDYYRARFTRELQLHCAPLLELPIGDVDRDVVIEWARGLEQAGLSPTTIRRLVVQAGSVQRAAVDAGLTLNGNPFAKLRTGRRDSDQHEEMVCLTPAEWERLKAALPAGVYRNLATVLVGTGLRWGEATALAVGAVDLEARPPRLHVGRAWKADGKNGWLLGPPKSQRSRRTVTFGSAVADALAAQLDGRGEDELVFTGPHGGAIRSQNFRQRVWLPATEAAGLPRRPRVHDLRHTHVSWLIAAGRPAAGISRRVGHESITTTIDRYGHLMPEVDDRDVQALDDVMPTEPDDED